MQYTLLKIGEKLGSSLMMLASEYTITSSRGAL